MDDQDACSETALARAAAPPTGKLAPSLNAANRGDLLYVDRKGRVLSPRRFRITSTIGGALAVAALGGVVTLYGVMFGTFGVVLGLLLMPLALMPLAAARRLRKVAGLIGADRLDEADAMLRRMEGRLWLNGRLRGMVALNQAAVAGRRGDFARALEKQREAIRRFSRVVNPQPFLTSARHGEIMQLVNLGRLTEARLVLGTLAEPQGEYLRVGYLCARLFVAFAEGRHDLSADELHGNAKTGLAMNLGGPLIALCAWGFAQLGDDDMAAHLCAEAIDRRPASEMHRTMPSLDAWLTAHAPTVSSR